MKRKLLSEIVILDFRQNITSACNYHLLTIYQKNLLYTVLLQNIFQCIHAGIMYSRYGNIMLFRLLIYAVHHFVRTGIRENNQKIGRSQLTFKIRRHLRKDFRLTVIFLTNVLVIMVKLLCRPTTAICISQRKNAFHI